MPRIFPPKWCRNYQLVSCNNCEDFVECDTKIIELFNRIRNVDKFTDVPTNATTIAIYYGYCQRLAKYFLSFPDTWPIGVVQRNFWNSAKGKRAEAEIQRIMLDLIDHGDPNAPTHLVHELRLKLILRGQKNKKGVIANENGEIEVIVSEKDAHLLDLMVQNWTMGHLNNALAFQKTENLQRCKYCFIANCEQS